MSVTRSTSNEPPSLWEALSPDFLTPFLTERFQRHILKRDELLAGFARFLKATHLGIADDTVAAKATDFSSQLRAAVADTEETHEAIKRPVLLATRQIDALRRDINEPIVAARTEVQSRITAYLDAKDRLARQAAQEEADRKAAEAQALMEQAAETNDAELMAEAEAVGEQAVEAETIVEATPAELTRIRTQLGSTVALRDNWTYVGVSDFNKIPPAYLMVNEAVVKAAIRSGTHEIPGLIIENRRKVR